MANFLLEIQKVEAFEGPYSNDAQDSGGETVWGISRRNHPEWKGWVFVDDCKRENQPISEDLSIKNMARDFYKIHFWDVFELDACGDQRIAGAMFDTAVNMGPSRAVAFLQRAINVLSGNDDPTLALDGGWGPATRAALEITLGRGHETLVYKIISALRVEDYVSIAEVNGIRRKYIKGWLKRPFPEIV